MSESNSEQEIPSQEEIEEYNKLPTKIPPTTLRTKILWGALGVMGIIGGFLATRPNTEVRPSKGPNQEVLLTIKKGNEVNLMEVPKLSGLKFAWPSMDSARYLYVDDKENTKGIFIPTVIRYKENGREQVGGAIALDPEEVKKLFDEQEKIDKAQDLIVLPLDPSSLTKDDVVDVEITNQPDGKIVRVISSKALPEVNSDPLSPDFGKPTGKSISSMEKRLVLNQEPLRIKGATIFPLANIK